MRDLPAFFVGAQVVLMVFQNVEVSRLKCKGFLQSGKRETCPFHKNSGLPEQ